MERMSLLPSPRAKGHKARLQRAALVRPIFLLTVMVAGVGGVSYWASAQGGRAPVAMPAKSGKLPSLGDLPRLVAEGGMKRAQKLASGQNVGSARSGQGGNLSGAGLVEVDLTPNSPSDERDPAYSPGGDYIAFISNGRDANSDGKIDSLNTGGQYHVWVMDRDGSDHRQVTGLFGDANRSQKKPAWSPDGNFLAYVDSSASINGGGAAPQLFVCEPFNDTDGSTVKIDVPAPEQRSFYAGNKISVAWAPTGLALTFACDANLDGDVAASGGQFDLFSVSPDGNTNTLVRLTGGTADPGGRTSNDLNPAYSLKNPSAIYYSSNRTNTGPLAAGRRIWVMASNGAGHRQVTSPVARGGKASDHDERPVLSLASPFFDLAGGFDPEPKERLAFQSNSATDASDTSPDGADRNIWQMEVDSDVLVPSDVTGDTATLVVSSFIGNAVPTFHPFSSPPITGKGALGTTIKNPEGIWVSGRSAYVSNSVDNRIEKYDVQTGNRLGAAAFASGGGLVSPAGIVGDVVRQYIYVAAGSLAPGGTGVRTAIYRYSLANGAPAGNPLVAGSAAWSSGDAVLAPLTGRCEGITFGPDANGDGHKDLYVVFLNQKQVNVYDGETGVFINISVASNQGLNFPTGVATLGNELYVASSQDHRVNVYALDNTGMAAAGSPLRAIGSRPLGVDQPEGVAFADLENNGSTELYVSSYASGLGRVICRYNPLTGQLMGANPGSAVWLDSPLLQGAGYFAFDDIALRGPVFPTPTPVPGTLPPVETGGQPSSLVSNYLSSPSRFTASLLGGVNAFEDKTADIEPAFGREASLADNVTTVAFSSGRRFAPAPAPSVNGATPTPAMFNPAGGKELNTNGTAVAPAKTHDIWVTSTLDTTVPALVPQGSGNQIFPVIAPGPQAPFRAPRTFEQGLVAGGALKIALVLRETESGINTNPAAGAVTVSFSNADSYRYEYSNRIVNESFNMEIARELTPANIPTSSYIPLQPYDDGPCADDGSGGCLADSPNVSQRRGGHERQAGAVAGDGTYYCESDPVKAPVKTPTSVGDYYIDVDVVDQQGNYFQYDKIWGFTTKSFQKGNNGKNDLFVSDYTVGQNFPYYLIDDPRFDGMMPVESYWLSNPGGTDVATGTPPLNTRTFANVDVWRILCRGAVPQDVLNTYKPRLTQHIDPLESPAVTPRFVKKTRNVAVAETAVIWASPYTGTAFAGPGTLLDAEVQRRLTAFLDGGGRLFVSGREIVFSLSSQGTTTNTFLEQELRAKYGSETRSETVTASAAGKFSNYGGDLDNLQFPERRVAGSPPSYTDAAFNLNRNQIGGIFSGLIDLIDPAGDSAGVTVTPAYTLSGRNVGQRIERTRANGLQSRVVLFTFGLEAVNRRYVIPAPAIPFRLDMRAKIGSNILNFFKTGSVSGKVVNDATNLPVSDFLIEVTGIGQLFYARTDKNGNFQLDGLPTGIYRAEPVTGTLATTISPNMGYYAGTPIFPLTVVAGTTTTDLTFRVIQRPPGSLSGYVVTNNGTPSDTTDDQPVANVPVLVRSIDESSIFPGGGKFASLTVTNASGLYSVPQVPALVPMEVVINPEVNDIPEESGLRQGYTAAGGANTNFGRRVVPDSNRPSSGGAEIQAPEGNNYVVNDGAGDTETDNGKPLILQVGAALAGRIFLDNVAQAGVTVTLSPVSVPGTSPIPAPVVTGPLGYYRFEGVSPGTWRVATTITYRGASLQGRRDIATVTGPDIRDRDVHVFAPKITGVVKNGAGQPVAGAIVTLAAANGGPAPFTRQATSSATGTFGLWYIQAGTYKVVASKGSLTGDSGVTPLSVTAFADTSSPDIILQSPQLFGRVLLNGSVSSGASVELLDGNGNPLSPARATTTGTDGFYGFSNPSGGTFRIRAIKSGATNTTSSFTVSAGAVPQRADINLYLMTVSGTVVKVDLTAASGASVTLTNAAGINVANLSTNASGAYSVAGIPAGTYTVRATLNSTSGQQSVTVVNNTNATVPRIVLQSGTVGTANFDVLGRTYAMSVPWEDTNAPTTNNSGANPATTLLPRAFTEPLKDANNRTNFVLQRFDAVSRQWVILGPTDTLRRGEGYLLGVVTKAVSLVNPTADSTRVPLDYTGVNGKFFTFTLRFNPSVTSDSKNGLNLIGFPFDPASVSSADWNSARVTWPGAPVNGPNGQPWTVTTAAAAGKMSAVLSSIDPDTGNGETSTSLRPFVGYYATAKVDNLQVTIQAAP